MTYSYGLRKIRTKTKKDRINLKLFIQISLVENQRKNRPRSDLELQLPDQNSEKTSKEIPFRYSVGSMEDRKKIQEELAGPKGSYSFLLGLITVNVLPE